MVEFAVEHFGERCDRVFELDVLAFAARELLGHEERLREETFETTSTTDDGLIVIRELFDTQNRDDVLQIAIALQRFLHATRDAIVFGSDDVRIENTR